MYPRASDFAVKCAYPPDVTQPTTRHPSGPLVPDRFVADHVGRLVGIRFHLEVRQVPLRWVGRLERGAADEVVIELDVPVHPCLERREDRPVLAEPRAEHLLQAHRQQRPHTEQTDAVWLAGGHEHIEHVTLVFGRHPELVAEITGVGHPSDPHGAIPTSNCRKSMNRKLSADTSKFVTAWRTSRDRGPASDSPTMRWPEHLERERGIRGQVLQEPATVALGGPERAEQEERIIGRAGRRRTHRSPGRAR